MGRSLFEENKFLYSKSNIVLKCTHSLLNQCLANLLENDNEEKHNTIKSKPIKHIIKSVKSIKACRTY